MKKFRQSMACLLCGVLSAMMGFPIFPKGSNVFINGYNLLIVVIGCSIIILVMGDVE